MAMMPCSILLPYVVSVSYLGPSHGLTLRQMPAAWNIATVSCDLLDTCASIGLWKRTVRCFRTEECPLRWRTIKCVFP